MSSEAASLVLILKDLLQRNREDPRDQKRDLQRGRYWVGVWNDSPPTEKDLRRPGTLHGADVTLGDGKPWMIPAPDFLPHDMMLADDGSVVMEPKRRYQNVCIEAKRIRNLIRSAEVVKIDYARLWAFCLLCLSLNYRLPPELASHQRLIDTENVKNVVMHAIQTEND